MKLHKRLMQSLTDARKASPVSKSDWNPIPHFGRKISVQEANSLAQGAVSTPVRKVRPMEGALKFIGTQVKRWDGDSAQWVNYRMPGMHRRGGKWVQR